MDRIERAFALAIGVAAFFVSVAAFSGCSRTGLLDPIEVSDIEDASQKAIAHMPDASEADAAIVCSPGRFDLERAPLLVSFVIDASSSMVSPLESQDGTSKWQALTDAFAYELPRFDDEMVLGAYIFPSIFGADCTVFQGPTLSPQKGNVSALLDVMRSRQPGGGTPTDEVLKNAGNELLGMRAAKSARALVLATDGAPNCNNQLDVTTCACTATDGTACIYPEECLDDARTLAEISALASQGLPTYVVGIESSEDAAFESVLRAMAIAGGKPSAPPSFYYPARSATELDDALTSIVSGGNACTFLTSSVPNDDGTIEVFENGVLIPYDASGETGWRWGDRSIGEIILSPNECAEVQKKATLSLTATIACGR